jgi:hypothetical protein
VQRVETARTETKTSARLVIIIVVTVGVGLWLFNRPLLGGWCLSRRVGPADVCRSGRESHGCGF